MKSILPAIILLVFLCSCEKDTPLFGQYESIIGTWETISISYDSSDVRIHKDLPYKDLIIEANLNYEVYSDEGELHEHGSIEIVSQTADRLELYFAAERPAYSSVTGSYVFGVTNVELVSVTKDELEFITINAAFDIYSEREIHLGN
jgi:hypothetical protein